VDLVEPHATGVAHTGRFDKLGSDGDLRYDPGTVRIRAGSARRVCWALGVGPALDAWVDPSAAIMVHHSPTPRDPRGDREVIEK
jgi:hypothetical protein